MPHKSNSKRVSGGFDGSGQQSQPTSATGHPELETAAFLASIVESSNDAIISKDLNGIITSWNQGAERIFGYKPSEVIGRPITILIPPDHLKEEAYILGRIRSGERVEHFETVRRRKDGIELDVSLTVSPVRDSKGAVIGASKVARDVTEQRRAHDLLRQSEERYRVTLASIGDGVIATDEQGRVTFMNAVAEKLTGWRGEEAAGVPLDQVFRILNEITRKPVENPVNRVIETGGVVGLGNHTTLIAKDGREQPIDDSAAPIRRRDGSLAGVVLVFRDASEQRASQMTAQRLAALVQNSEDGIYSTDLQGIVTGWNPAAERIFGFSKAEVIGRPVSASIVPPDRMDEDSGILGRVQRGERIAPYETIRRRKDGSQLDISMTVSPINDIVTGRATGIFKIARDITQLKRAASDLLETGERYRALFNSMDEGFCVIQVIFDESNRPRDYCFLEVNPAFEKHTGIKDAVGRRVREIIPKHEQHWYDAYGKVALTGEPVRFENSAQAMNRWYDVFAYRVGRPEERKVAVLFNDITERKRIEQELAAAHAELKDYAHNLEALVGERTVALQQTIADLESFSFTISHDLRSPLRAIEGFSQVILSEYSDKLDDRGRDFLQRINKAAIRLDRLILEVLTYNRIGRAGLSTVRVSLDKLLEDVLQTYPEIRASNAEVVIDQPLHNVLAEQASLVQCISNLLNNAVKFVRPGSRAKVHVWTEKHNSTVRFFVEDHGIGIPENLQAKIFEPFQRGHPHGGYEGTGMGLAIVRKAIQRMNGTVGVNSQDGHGSTFWLELPAAPEV